MNDSKTTSSCELSPVDCLAKPLEVGTEESVAGGAALHEGMAEDDAVVGNLMEKYSTKNRTDILT